MRQLFILLFFGLSIGVFAQEEKAIKQSISVFFEGLQTSDTLKIQSVCHKDMKLQSIMEKTRVERCQFKVMPNFINP
jgi:hypothetical protein